MQSSRYATRLSLLAMRSGSVALSLGEAEDLDRWPADESGLWKELASKECVEGAVIYP